MISAAATAGAGFLVTYKGQQLRVPVARTRQLVQGARIHRMPGAHPFVQGIACVRGEILPVLDWTRLGLAEPGDRRGTNISHEALSGEDLLVLEDSRRQRVAFPIEGDPVQAPCTDSDLSVLASLDQGLRAGPAQRYGDGAGAAARGLSTAASKRQSGRGRSRGNLLLKAGGHGVVVGLEALVGFSDGRHVALSPAHLSGLHGFTTFRDRAYPVIRLASLLGGEHSCADSAGSLLAYVSLGEVIVALLVDDIAVVAQDLPTALGLALVQFHQLAFPKWLDDARADGYPGTSRSASVGVEESSAQFGPTPSRTESELRGRALEFELGPSGGRLRCAVEIANVLRILRARPMARLPGKMGKPPCALALIEDRGRVLPCIDGAVLTGRNGHELAQETRKGGFDLVLRGPRGEFALRVESVIGLASYADRSAKKPSGGAEEGLQVLHRDGRVCVLLSAAGISSFAQEAMA